MFLPAVKTNTPSQPNDKHLPELMNKRRHAFLNKK